MNDFELGWITGIYEGEGHCRFHSKTVLEVVITQKDRWLLDKMKGITGGTIYRRKDNSLHSLVLRRSEAASLLLKMFPHLSPRRQEQSLIALESWCKRVETLGPGRYGGTDK